MNREARNYLLLMAFYTLGTSLSNTFFSVFIWKLNSSFTLLARFSLVYSLVVVLSFPLCAVLARRKTPMASLRLGIAGIMSTYLLVLCLQGTSARYIDWIGIANGLGSSFFAIGMHMQMLDSTQNQGRDRYLYISNLLNNIASMIGPFAAGYLIDHFAGMRGYYFVFGLSVVWFVVAVHLSFTLKGKRVAKTSHFREVWKHPTKAWRGMYWVTIGSGFVEGTYYTFLVTMMGYSILKNELSLGGVTTFSSVVGLIASLILAKVSKPERRLKIFSLGALVMSLSSIWISVTPTFAVLIVYTVLSSFGQNLINTTFNAWTYASIEQDPQYEARRLDYIVIREIPLGIGRTIGIVFFLTLQMYISAGAFLAVSFAIFGSVFVLWIPVVAKIWRGEGRVKQRDVVVQG